MMNYNKFQGSSKGWRFSPKVLRWALYALANMGSAGYNVIQDVLHLPSIGHLRKVRRAAAGTTTWGVQHHLVEAYGKMAAEDNLGRFDLCGILVWDLMHLNTNGFKVRPNGGGIQGLVDPDSILRHPLDGVKGVADNISLEETLETFVATQYLEVFWVSIGNLKYKFCVYREAVKGLTGPKLKRMLNEVMLRLYTVHEDKQFDVICTVCDGAAEHRSFQ
ncbi:unnamed protein product [Ectocarpus sp. CCAP 1310/34]|nr:unnamed protein product [Ectocarpus sp. CCAP 1310/34]